MLVEDYLIPSSYKPGSSVLSVRIKTLDPSYKNPIVLTHGKAIPFQLNWDFTSDDQSFADILASRGCTVIMLAATGFGLSTKFDEMSEPPVRSNYINTYNDYYRDMTDLLLWLKNEKLILKPALVSWSSSTVPALMVADRQPELISNLICYGFSRWIINYDNQPPKVDPYNYEAIDPDAFVQRRNLF